MNGFLGDNGINGVVYARPLGQVILQLSMEIWQADPDRSIRKRVRYLARPARKISIDKIPITPRKLGLYLFRQGLLSLCTCLWRDWGPRLFGCPRGWTSRSHCSHQGPRQKGTSG